jgi:hypothetical protein
MVLQNCVDFVEGENDSCSETCVMFEEVTIKVEEAIGIKDEIPEPTSFITPKTEHEVRLCDVCEVVAAHALSHLLPQQASYEITLNYFLLCVILWVHYAF